MNSKNPYRISYLRGFGPEIERQIAAGNQDALLKALWHLADSLLKNGGAALSVRFALSASSIAALPADKRGLLAAGCDLADLLAHSPQGREALLQFGFEPVFEEAERE